MGGCNTNNSLSLRPWDNVEYMLLAGQSVLTECAVRAIPLDDSDRPVGKQQRRSGRTLPTSTASNG